MPQGAVPESGGDPRKNRIRHMESGHPKGGMAYNSEDVSHEARRQGLVSPQRDEMVRGATYSERRRIA